MTAVVSDIHLVVDQEQYDFLIEIYKGVTDAADEESQTPTNKALLKKGEMPVTGSKLAAGETTSLSPSTAKVLSEIRLSLGDVTLDLIDSRRTGSKDRYQIVLTQPTIKYTSLSDKSSFADIQIGETILRNKKPGKTLFPNLISGNSETGKQLSMTYTQPRIGSAKFIAIWDSVVLVLELDVIYEIIDFFSKPWLKIPKNARPAQSTYTTSYQLKLSQPEILLLDSRSNASSEAIRVMSSHILVTMDAILSVNAEDLRMILTTMDLKDELSIKLSDPFTIDLTMDSQMLDQTRKSTNVNLDVSPVTIYLVFSDFAAVYSIITKNLIGSTKNDTQPAADSSIKLSEWVSLSVSRIISIVELQFQRNAHLAVGRHCVYSSTCARPLLVKINFENYRLVSRRNAFCFDSSCRCI